MKVAIFAGPTGGHFYPALSFSEAFKKRHPTARILFVTGERGRFLAQKAKARADLTFEFLPDFPLPRPNRPDFVVRIFGFLLRLSYAFLKTGKILKAFRPNLTIGFGSYLSFPGLWVSRRWEIPTLLHEQNQKMGRANALLSNFVDRIALSFEADPHSPPSSKTLLTGLPLRASLVEAAAQKRLPNAPPVLPERVKILVLGGSQGSQSLNALWRKAVELLSDEEKSKIAVIHITGERDFEALKNMYPSQGIEAGVFSFYERMEEIYSQVDLALTRAGAGTLFELAAFKLPAVVIPYPHADGHQEPNARSFEKAGGIQILLEREGTPQKLKETLFRLVDSPVLRRRMAENLIRCAKVDASQRLVDVTEELLVKKEACLQ